MVVTPTAVQRARQNVCRRPKSSAPVPPFSVPKPPIRSGSPAVVQRANSGTLNDSTATLTWSGFGTLNGGTSTDDFVFSDTATLTGTLNGGAGNDTLDYSAYTTATDIVLTGTSAANGLSGTDGGITGGFTGINVLDGSATAANSLTGENTANTWDITGNNSGTLNDTTATLTWSSFGTLNGGSSTDSFTFTVNGKTLTGTINGGAGVNSLSYSGYTGAVNVTLTGSGATGYSGTDGGITAGFSNIGTLTGGSTASSLTGENTANTWDITGNNSGTLNDTTATLTWSSFGTLNGGSSTDDFVFSAGKTLAGTVNGGGGADTLDLSAYTTATNIVLTSSTANGYTGTAGAIIAGFTGIDTIVGGTVANSLTGENTTNTWDITGHNAGTLNDGTTTLNWSNFGSLVGGTANDDFVFSAGVTLSGTVAGGLGGVNILDMSAYTTAVNVTLASSTATGYTGTTAGATNPTGGFSNITQINDGSGANSLTGENTANTWDITGANSGTLNDSTATLTWSGFGTLNGGTSTDDFVFSDTATLTGTLNGGAGNDTLDYSAYTTATDIVLTGTSAANGLSGTDGGITGGFTGINVLDGSATAANSLTGENTANTWDITNNNAGTLNDSTATLNWSGFGTLVGGSSTDSFTFTVNGKTLTGTINGGAGVNSLSYSGYTGAVNVTLTGSGATGYSGTDGGITAGFSNIGTLTGGSTASSLTGENTANTWDITGNNSGTLNDTTATLTWSSFGTLNGGSSTDDFVFSAGKTLAGTVNGGGGADTLDLSAYTTATNIVLTSSTANGYTGTAGAIIAGFTGIDTIVGGTVANSLTGENTTNTWDITGHNAGTLNDGTTTLNWSNFGSLVGGSADDTFVVATAGSLTGSLNGGGFTTGNTLSYAGNANTGIIVSASGGGTSIAGGFSNIQDLIGNDGTSGSGFTLVGDNSVGGDIFDITGQNSGTLSYNSGGSSLIFSGVGNLTGGTQNDAFIFGAAGSLGGTIDGGAGVNSLDVSALGTTTVTLTSSGTGNGYSGTSGVGVATFSDISSITGASGSTLTSSLTAAASTWTITGADTGTVQNNAHSLSFAGFSNLTGSTADDTFILSGGSISGTIDGGGGSGVDTLVGDSTGDYFDITGSDAGSVGTSSGTPTNLVNQFTGIQNLTGGVGNDTFAFQGSSGITGTIDGGGGSNTVDYSGSTVTSVTLGAALPGAGSITNIQQLIGNASFTLIADGFGDVFDITGGDSGNVSYGSGGSKSIMFSNVPNLEGGAGVDVFEFTTVTASIGNIIGTGNDELDYSGYTGGTISVDLATGTATLITGTFSFIDDLVGTGTGDTLTGANGGNAWSITGLDSGKINGTFTFSEIANLVAGTGSDTFTLAGGSIDGSITGGGGNDTIIGNNSGDFFTINAANGGTVGTTLGGTDLINSFSGISNLTGGTGNDTFAFANGATLSGTIDGVSGTDTIDYSAYTSGVTVTLNSSGTNGYAGTDGGISGGFSNIDKLMGSTGSTLQGETAGSWSITGADSGTYNDGGGHGNLIWSSFANLTGGTGNDTFTIVVGGSIDGTISGGGGSGVDTLIGDANGDYFDITGADAGSVGANSGTPTSLVNQFTGIANLTGGAGADDFVFASGATLTGTINGGSGSNTIDYSAYATGVTVTLNSSTANGYTGADGGISGGFSNISTLVGSAGSTLIGRNVGSTWTINGVDTGTYSDGTDTLDFQTFANLTGGTGTDSFDIVTGGSLSGAIDGGTGVNTLSYSGDGTATVAVQLTGANAGTATSTGGFSNISVLVGDDSTSRANTTLIGDSANDTFTLTSVNGGTLTYGSGSMTFSGVGNLTGGSGNNIFHVGSAGGLAGAIDGGTGTTETLSYSGDAGAVTVTLTGANAGTATSIAGGFSDINTLVGDDGTSGTNTTLVGDSANDTFALGGANSGTLTYGSGTFAFSGVGNLSGGSGNNTFTIGAGSLSGAIDGGTGTTETLDYSTSTGPVTVTLSGNEAGSGTSVGSFSNINTLVGSNSATSDTLADSAAGVTFDITSVDGGSVSGVAFSSFEKLKGTGGGDTYSLNGGYVTTIAGGASDTIIVQTATNAGALALSYSAGTIESAAAGDVLTASSLTLSGLSTTGGGVGLETNVSNLAINNSTGGAAVITNAGALVLSNIDLTGGSLNLTVDTGDLTGGTITAGSATLTTDNGNIGASASSQLSTNVGSLTASATGGSIWVKNVGTGSLAVGNITSTGSISIDDTGGNMSLTSDTLTSATGTTLTTTATNGAMTLDGVTVVNGLTLTNSGTLTINSGGLHLTTNGAALTQSGTGGTVLNGNIQTNKGNVSFRSGVTVNGSIGVTTGGGSASFSGTINGGGGSAFSLNTGAGNILLAGVSLSMSSGTLALMSTGTVTFDSNVAASNVNLTGVTNKLAIGGNLSISTGNTNLDLGKIAGGIDDTAAGTHGLTINTGSGSVSFGSTKVGSVRALRSLTIKAASMSLNSVGTTGGQSYTGITQLNGNLTNSGGGSISLQGGAVTLAQNVTLDDTAGNISIASTVNGSRALTLDSGGDVSLTGVVGGSALLSSLTVTGKGITTEAVDTTGNQSYTGTLSLKGDLTSDNGILDFKGKVQVLNSVTLVANQMNFSGGAGTVSGTKTLTILPKTAGYTVNLGSGGSSSTQLMLDSDAFDGYQGTLYIGGTPGTVNDAASSLAGLPTAGSVLVDGDMSLGASGTLVIVSKGDLTLQSGTISAGTVILGASNDLLSAPTGTSPATVEGNDIYTIATQIGQNGTGQAIDVGNLPSGAPAQLFIGSKNSSVFFVEAPGTQENKDPNEQTLVDFADALDVSPLSGNVTVTNSGQQTAANQQTGGLLTSGFIDVSVFQQISLYDVSGSGIALPGDQCEEESSGSNGVCGAGGQ